MICYLVSDVVPEGTVEASVCNSSKTMEVSVDCVGQLNRGDRLNVATGAMPTNDVGKVCC